VGSEVSIIPRTRNVYYAAYASLPTSGVRTGDLGYATDRKVFYRWSGSAWEPVSIHSSSGAAADIPTAANLPDGSLYYETDATLLKQVQSGAWAIISPTPTFASLSDTKVVCKTADETINDSATMQDDDELVIAVGANEIWYLQLWVRVLSMEAADFKWQFTVPVAATIEGFDLNDVGVATGAAPLRSLTLAGIQAFLVAGASEYALCISAVYVGGANAGNIQLQWAQNTADASDTKVLANSFITAHKLN